MKRNLLSKLFQASLVCCLAVILTGCEELFNILDNPIQTSISMATSDVKLSVGDTYQRQATCVSPATIVYASSNAAVATVDANGVVTGVAAGEATITASVAAIDYWTAASASYKVIVSAKTPAIEVNVGNSGLLAGKFSVSATKQVQFSQGNLQATYDGTKWTWAFAANQYDYIGNAEGNTKVTNSAPFVAGYTGSSTTVDLFGWVGASSTVTGAAQYGISSSTTYADYGTVMGENLKVDWGATIGTNWRTLSKDEWAYLFSTRTTGGTVFGTASARYAHATINTDVTSVNGMILFPDGVDIAASEVTTAGTVNSSSVWGTKCTSAQWTALAAKGCVFLPAVGVRNGTTVIYAGSEGYYWSSSSLNFDASAAYRVNFYSYSDGLTYGGGIDRYNGLSVRLVRDVATE
jgi:hypothetical protein